MHLHRLLHTTALRLALRYALFYALLITLGLGVLYWTISRYVDVQMAAGLEQELTRLVQIDRRNGRERLVAVIAAEQQTGNDNNRRYYLLQSPDGRRQSGNLADWPSGFVADRRVHNIWVAHEVIPEQLSGDDGFWPTIGATLDDGSRLLVAQGVRQAEDLQEFMLGTMAIILGVSVGLALTMGWLLGRTLLQRIDVINSTAQRVTAGELSKRVALSGQHDEFDELAGHLNTMLARIEKLLTGMREVTDNVAHDLRRPLTRLRNRIEVTLMEERNSQEYRRVLEETLEDANELMKTFSALLEIAQAEAGSFRGEWKEVDLSMLLEELGGLYFDEAEVRRKRFELRIDPGLTLTGNRHLLAQAISNLLDNAFKYTPDDSAIRLQAAAQPGYLKLTVSDNGPGIAIEQRARVLERFVRLDVDRSTAGNGLGLSLVKAVADLHEAELRLEDNRPGLRVVLRFVI
jgi:signal transduction histidine kinase